MAADEKSGHTLGQGPRSGDVGGSRNASMVAMPAPVAVSRRNGDVDVASVDRRRPRGPGPMAGGANPLAALLASLGGGGQPGVAPQNLTAPGLTTTPGLPP